MTKFSAVILAAGASERFGGNKLLLTLGTQTVLGHVLEKFKRDEIAQIIVVGGKYFDDLRLAFQDPGIQWVRNDRFAEGMSSSVRMGFDALTTECGGVFVMPADIPFVRHETVDAMIKKFEKGDIIIPAFAGQKGHPVLLDWRFRNVILTLKSSKLLHDVVQRNKDDVRLLETDDEWILRDLDTRDDYEKLLWRIKEPLK